MWYIILPKVSYIYQSSWLECYFHVTICYKIVVHAMQVWEKILDEICAKGDSKASQVPCNISSNLKGKLASQCSGKNMHKLKYEDWGYIYFCVLKTDLYYMAFYHRNNLILLLKILYRFFCEMKFKSLKLVCFSDMYLSFWLSYQ